jgi:putative protein-disulfide isomerase
MSGTKLRYIFDPLCGWCYAASPLIRAAEGMAGLAITLHGGGLMTGPNRRPVTPGLRDDILQHDRRIAALTGLPFAPAYSEGLLGDGTVVLDSEPPIAAILAAGDRGLDLLARLQTAHYVEGLRISDPKTLADLAASIGLETKSFLAAFERSSGQTCQRHIEQSRRLLDQAGGNGFPTFALETGAGLELLNHAAFYGKPQMWAGHLESKLG